MSNNRARNERRRVFEFQYTASNDASGLLNFLSDASADEHDGSSSSFIDLEPVIATTTTATAATTTTATTTTPDKWDNNVLPFSDGEEPLAVSLPTTIVVANISKTESEGKNAEMTVGSNDVEFLLDEFPEPENESRDRDETTTMMTMPTSHSCAPHVTHDDPASTDDATNAAANRNSERVERVIRFDYDLLLSNIGDASGAGVVDSILRNLQENLLDRVGSTLDDVGLCRTDGRGENRRRRRRRRYLTEEAEAVVTLEEISSLPSDEVMGGASCVEDNGNDDDTACYPIAGYMTAYYYNVNATAPTTSTTADASITTKTADDIEMTIRDIVQRGMESQSSPLSSREDDGGGIVTARAYYVGDRDASSTPVHPNAEQLLPSSSVRDGAQDEASDIPLFAGGILAAAVVLLFAAFLALRLKKNRKGEDNEVEEGDGAHRRDMGKVVMYPPPPIVNDVYTIDSKRDPDPPLTDNNNNDDDAAQWLKTSFTTDTDSTPIASNRTGAVPANSKGGPAGYASALSSYFGTQNTIEEEGDWEEDDDDDDDIV